MKKKLTQTQRDYLFALGAATTGQEALKGVPVPIPMKNLLGCFLCALVSFRQKYPNVDYKADKRGVVDCFMRGVTAASRVPRQLTSDPR